MLRSLLALVLLAVCVPAQAFNFASLATPRMQFEAVAIDHDEQSKFESLSLGNERAGLVSFASFKLKPKTCHCGEDCRCTDPLACETGTCHTEQSIEVPKDPTLMLALAEDTCDLDGCSVNSSRGGCSSGACQSRRSSCSTSGCSSKSGNCGSGNRGSQGSGYKFGQPVRNTARWFQRHRPVRRVLSLPFRALRGFGCRGCR